MFWCKSSKNLVSRKISAKCKLKPYSKHDGKLIGFRFSYGMSLFKDETANEFISTFYPKNIVYKTPKFDAEVH